MQDAPPKGADNDNDAGAAERERANVVGHKTMGLIVWLLECGGRDLMDPEVRPALRVLAAAAAAIAGTGSISLARFAGAATFLAGGKPSDEYGDSVRELALLIDQLSLLRRRQLDAGGPTSADDADTAETWRLLSAMMIDPLLAGALPNVPTATLFALLDKLTSAPVDVVSLSGVIRDVLIAALPDHRQFGKAADGYVQKRVDRVLRSYVRLKA